MIELNEEIKVSSTTTVIREMNDDYDCCCLNCPLGMRLAVELCGLLLYYIICIIYILLKQLGDGRMGLR